MHTCFNGVAHELVALLHREDGHRSIREVDDSNMYEDDRSTHMLT